MPRDYYMVLGVERGADLSQIKHAYRRAIKRYHPDHFGTGIGPDKFLAAQEAYEVLSDRNRRRAYDAEVKREGIPVHITNVRETLRRHHQGWGNFRETRSPPDDFFAGRRPAFFRQRIRHASIPKDVYLEVVLAPEEARRGGIFPVAVPVFEPCPACARSDWQGHFYCPACRGYGVLRSRREFKLTIPPGVTDGTTAEVSLTDAGLPAGRLLIDIRVEG
jgi:molecular chaperone DnaJ